MVDPAMCTINFISVDFIHLMYFLQHRVTVEALMEAETTCEAFQVYINRNYLQKYFHVTKTSQVLEVREFPYCFLKLEECGRTLCRLKYIKIR